MIRRARPADLDAIERLERENLGDDAWSRGLIADGVGGTLPTIHYLVAEAGGVVVGHAVSSAAGDIVELQRIAVDAAHRRTGLASELLVEVVALAGRAGADRLLLEVRADNAAALAFYAARGFAEIDRRRRYYRDGGTAVVMHRGIGSA